MNKDLSDLLGSKGSKSSSSDFKPIVLTKDEVKAQQYLDLVMERMAERGQRHIDSGYTFESYVSRNYAGSEADGKSAADVFQENIGLYKGIINGSGNLPAHNFVKDNYSGVMAPLILSNVFDIVLDTNGAQNAMADMLGEGRGGFFVIGYDDCPACKALMEGIDVEQNSYKKFFEENDIDAFYINRRIPTVQTFLAKEHILGSPVTVLMDPKGEVKMQSGPDYAAMLLMKIDNAYDRYSG